MNLTTLEKKLKLYGKEGYNVLLTGKHGVGKTEIKFESHNCKTY